MLLRVFQAFQNHKELEAQSILMKCYIISDIIFIFNKSSALKSVTQLVDIDFLDWSDLFLADLAVHRNSKIYGSKEDEDFLNQMRQKSTEGRSDRKKEQFYIN